MTVAMETIPRVVHRALQKITHGPRIDVYYNEQHGTVAYALIEQNERIHGADDSGAQRY